MLRIGIVGAGKMAHEHARALKQCGVANELVGVAEPDSEARSSFAAAWPGCEGFHSLSQLVQERGPDALHICTPAATHVALCRAAIEAGCHVYVEKPFAQRVRDAEELFRLAAQRTVRLCAGHQLLYARPTLLANRILPAIGRVVQVESFFSFRMVRRGTLADDEQLLDILPHPTYLLLHFLAAAADQSATEPSQLAVDVSGEGTVSALLRAGTATGNLVVTLAGRPVESFVRIVGTNGTIQADYVRETVQRLIGPGASGIDKALNPYRVGRQLAWGTTASLLRRLRERRASYPGLAETFAAFYSGLERGDEAVRAASVIATTRVLERVADNLASLRLPSRHSESEPTVAVTGGTGLLGTAIVKSLVRSGHRVRVLARRRPAPWGAVPGVDYQQWNLSLNQRPEALRGASVIVHCAAETMGGWREHKQNSVVATENLMRAAHAAGVRKILHISSVAVVAAGRGQPIDEAAPHLADPRAAGPYVWGKLEAEKAALREAEALGLDLRIVRPGAIIDRDHFDPPGRLGKRLGNLFVAVGSPKEILGVVDLDFAASALCWGADHFAEIPKVLNLLTPEPPSKGELVAVLRRRNPDLRVIWLPRWSIAPLAIGLRVIQRVVRPGRPAIDVARVFERREYRTALVARLARRLEGALTDPPAGPSADRISGRHAGIDDVKAREPSLADPLGSCSDTANGD